MDQLAPLHPAIQYQSYCGNIPELLDYMIQQGLNTIPTSQIRTWLSNNMHCMPPNVSLFTCHIDHIIPQDMAGIDHPYNYFIMSKTANSHFKNYVTHEKIAYIGKENYSDVRNFAKWVRSQTLTTIVNHNQFAEVRNSMKEEKKILGTKTPSQDELLEIYNDIKNNAKNDEEVHKVVSTLPIKAKKPSKLMYTEEKYPDGCPIKMCLDPTTEAFIEVVKAIQNFTPDYANIQCKSVKRTSITTYRVDVVNGSPGCCFCLHANTIHNHALIYFIITIYDITQYCYDKTCSNSRKIVHKHDNRKFNWLLFQQRFLTSRPPKLSTISIRVNGGNPIYTLNPQNQDIIDRVNRINSFIKMRNLKQSKSDPVTNTSDKVKGERGYNGKEEIEDEYPVSSQVLN